MRKDMFALILSVLIENPEGVERKKLLSLSGKTSDAYVRAKKRLERMERDGIIVVKKGNCRLKNREKYFYGTVTDVYKTIGYIKEENSDESEIMVRGKSLIGAIPGDYVLAEKIIENRRRDERVLGEVIAILKYRDEPLSGIVLTENKQVFVLPETYVSDPIPVLSARGLKANDRVSFMLAVRGKRHSEHKCKVLESYGSADVARNSTMAYLDVKGIPHTFSDETITAAKKIAGLKITSAEEAKRTDLRDEIIFTIDGADTKDIDDAISIKRKGKSFELGVHIADVSHYVGMGTPLDNEAFIRGTSVYVADIVIPMLPKELSNGICSLNPNVDRLAFSCIMNITASGEIKSFQFKKTIIRSRIQGVYSEINTIIRDENSDETVRCKEKYNDLLEQIGLMKELADILNKNRIKRGAPMIVTKEAKIICDSDGKCIDIKNRADGISENFIEEFMLAANNCAAKLAKEKGFPFVYRVHESPSTEKLLRLSDSLVYLGVDNLGINEKSTAADLANVLTKVKGTEKESIVNMLVLRSMMKAKYSEEPVGHFGLVMDDYAHFTSPIRRYSDLAIHRILTDYLKKSGKEKLFKRYEDFSSRAAVQSSNTELRAVNAERDCDKYYMAEYMSDKVGEEFDAVISGVVGNGFFVELENSVEGKVSILTLSEGDYETEHNISLRNLQTNEKYTLGDRIKVKCTNVNVGAGLIDFQMI